MRVAAVLFIRNVSYRVHRFWHKDIFNFIYESFETKKKLYHHNSLMDKLRRKFSMTCLCPKDKRNKMFRFWFWTCEYVVERLCYWAEKKLEYDYNYRDTD